MHKELQNYMDKKKHDNKKKFIELQNCVKDI